MKASASLLRLAMVLTLATIASAQLTIPHGFATSGGVSYTHYPFGWHTASRVQYLYDASLVLHPVTQIRELAVRGFANQSGAQKTVELEIRLSSTTARFDAASTSFAQNTGANVAIALRKTRVKLPGFAPSPVPKFTTSFKLDKPFVYIKLLGNFLIDYIVSAAVVGSYATNVVWDRSERVRTIGASCARAVQFIEGGRSLTASSNLVFNLRSAPANSAAVHVFGLQRLAKPARLPFGGCLLEIAPLLLRGRVTSASGTASAIYPTPLGTRTVSGPQVFGQWIVIGSSWDASNANEVIVGGFLRCARVFNLSSATAPTGTVQVGAAIVHLVR